MARKRLPFFFYSGDDPTISLDNERFVEVETSYGAPIPIEARPRLVSLCNQYLFSRRTELHSKSWSDVAAALQPYERAVEALWAVSFPEGRKDDAETEMEVIFDRHLATRPIAIYPSRDETGLDGIVDPFPIFPNYSMMTRLAMSLRIALNLSKAEIEQHRNAQPDRLQLTAFQQWIIGLTDWAKTYRLPRSPYVYSTYPDKFSYLVSALHQIMPPDLRETGMETADAAAAKIKRARLAGAKVEREQKKEQDRKLNAPFESK